MMSPSAPAATPARAIDSTYSQYPVPWSRWPWRAWRRGRTGSSSRCTHGPRKRCRTVPSRSSLIGSPRWSSAFGASPGPWTGTSNGYNREVRISLRGLGRGRTVISVVGSVAAHLLVLGVLVWVKPPSMVVDVKRGEPLFVELPAADEPAQRGLPPASTPERPKAQPAPRPVAPAASPAPVTPSPPMVARAVPEPAPPTPVPPPPTPPVAPAPAPPPPVAQAPAAAEPAKE